MLVYKYKEINIIKDFERDLSSIENNQFWSSTIEQLNDPCEAITDTKKIKNLLRFISKILGFISEEDLKLIDDNTDQVLSLDDKMGIFSLSKTPLDELLWAHYANSHKGYCLGYELETLLESDGYKNIHSYPVIYTKKPASIGYFDVIKNKSKEMIQKFAFYKSKRWEYEQEHRIVTSKIGSNSYNYKALKSIYFGLRITDFDRDKIIDRLNGRGINFYQIKLEKNSYIFKALKLIENNDKINYLNHIPTSVTKDKIIEYRILKSKIFNFASIGEFEIMLERDLTENELKWIIGYLKNHLFKEGKSLFFNFYTNPNQIDNLPWVSVIIKDDKTDIQYNLKN